MKEKQIEEEEEYYTEPVRYGLSETIRKANWGPFIFYVGLASTGTIILLYIGLALGAPLLYMFLAFAVVLDLLCIWNAKAYGLPGSIITESCEFVGFRRIFLKFPDGRERMNEGDLYWDTSVGDNGMIPLNQLHKYVPSQDAERLKQLSHNLNGCVMKLHLKSNYGRASSMIMLIHLPDHILNFKSSILPVLVAETEERLTANKREWWTVAGAFYNPLSTPSETQFKFLKQAPAVAEMLVDLVKSDELEAENTALKMLVESRENMISKLLKAREEIQIDREAAEETGLPKKWYEIPAVRILLELMIVTGIVIAAMFVAGVVF